MKWMIASDVHGSAYWCGRLMEAFHQENADRLLLLGDLLYHGPRNALPRDYAPMETAGMLNAVKNAVFFVRGNCEAEVDQMVLAFPALAEYALLDLGNVLVFATHGHQYPTKSMPPLHRGDILLYGHTHVPACEEKDGVILMNPGSVSIPKDGAPHSYMTVENGLFLWKDLEGADFMRYSL